MLTDNRLDTANAALFDKTHLIVDYPDGTTAALIVERLARLEAQRQCDTGFSDPRRYSDMQP